jgi:hypothetical protein
MEERAGKIINRDADEEVKAFEAASIEFTTIDKTYCSNSACDKFFPPEPNVTLMNTARCKAVQH